MKYILTFGLALLFINLFGQDTVRINRKPKVILKSWYPDFKDFPSLKIRESKILYTEIPDFEKLSIRDNDINLKVKNDNVVIKETEKSNQYLVTIKTTKEAYVVFEVWFDVGKKVILLKHNSKWQDIRSLYTCNGNRVLIETIRLRVKN